MTIEEAARAAAEDINAGTDLEVLEGYIEMDAAIIVRHMQECKLIAAAPEMAEMLLSMHVHVSHGGPTRAEAEALLRKAGVL